ncbi:uncharacterized protein involved in outer membrane biogenesis [Roseibium hamelinense]|uniref:Uncharacterized protein involved in outer membrane biogenesis n=1 Tax=Roseibium hamelinense TaxID=150831 RepID=A0A562SKT6_9HYPH|nr:AsmA family protein [Roseibium hamelinense]MTI43466.1 AsmA family protein [Roseibium hamelinense]TWI81927.1 uncharacterized protein involved in outer membrane biogenesis [Roseibium hamelinense]
MRRLIIGLGSLFFVLATIVVVAPFLLPKDTIKAQVITQVERASGWRLRLDGPVSLSLIPQFTLVAEKVGMSGEAGADGIEFAKADKIEFGLTWSALLGGDINVTGITLSNPEILLEVSQQGKTSWAPRKRLEDALARAAAEAAGDDIEPIVSNEPENAEEAVANANQFLERVGVDRFTISNGHLTYLDLRDGHQVKLGGLNAELSAPDLTGEVTVDASFDWNGEEVRISGALIDPIAFSQGKVTELAVTLAAAEAEVFAKGKVGLTPLQLDLEIGGQGPSVQNLAAVVGTALPVDPGAFSLASKITGTQAAAQLSDFSASLGSLALTGALDADLSSEIPSYSGRFVMKDGSLADLLALAGQSYPASGTLEADLAVRARGGDAAMILGTMDVRGRVDVQGGTVEGLGLSEAVGDPLADRLENINLNLVLAGFSNPVDLSGTFSWRDEAFTITGGATPAPILAGMAAPVSASVKGKRVSFGFVGTASASGGLDGAVTVETQSLRNLLAWMGQPVADGSGLQRFKAAGLFTVEPSALSFEETSFTLDETSGQAQGRVTFGAKPTVEGDLRLTRLVLDPYLGKSSLGSRKNTNEDQHNSATSSQIGSTGWSAQPIDFSGLSAVDVDFKVSAEEIRWDEISIGRSVLSATIRSGVLTANLQELSLYDGSGSGQVVLNGAAALPSVAANFALNGVQAFPVLRDAADFEWLEGIASIDLDVTSSGASQQQLVSGLNGAAQFSFADGAIRGINLPKMVRGLSVETLLGWQENRDQKTDFSSLSASFNITNGIAISEDLAMVGPLVRMTGAGMTDIPAEVLDWRVEPRIVPTLQGQAPVPRKKGEDKKLAGLGVPILIKGSWDRPSIYPDIAGILENPAEAYKQLEGMGGELIEIIKNQPEDQLVDAANEIINRATGGNSQIDVQKVIDGEVNDQEVLKAVEEGFGLPSGLLGNVFGGRRNSETEQQQ